MKQILRVVMAAVLVVLLSWGSVASGFAQEATGRPFITKWQGKAGEVLKFPIVGTDYKLVIKDAQGKVVKSEEKVTVEGTDESYYHAFTPTADGVYTVEAGPEGVKAMQMRREETSNDQLLEVVQFGTVAWESMEYMFRECEKMTFAASIDIPDLTKVTNMSCMFWYCETFNQPLNNWTVSQVTDMSWMFLGCTSFNQPLDKWDVSKVTNMYEMFDRCTAFNQPLDKWDVSKVTNMGWMFLHCSAFNQPLNNWDVSKVTNMYEMFYGCTAFNQPLNNWDVSKVTNMYEMFENCSAFNQPLEKWDVSQVTDMNGMFYGCTAFNQPLDNWTVSQVTDMRRMFYGCTAFNQPLEKWDVSKMTSMSEMFKNCSAFNQPLEKWDVSKVTDMGSMFSGCTSFNQPLETWDVSKVTSMYCMFDGCSVFNQPLEKWDVSNVTGMSSMFSGCSAFNQPLNNWDVSKVTSMFGMFWYCRAFNQPLNNWTVSQVTNMCRMFWGCTSFNQPLEKWDVSNVTDMDAMFFKCQSFNQPLGAWKIKTAVGGLGSTAMSVENYSQSLIGWAKQTDGATDIYFGEKVKGLIYNDAGKAAREKLIARGWSFHGDIYQLSKKVAISLAKEGEGTLAIEGYNDEALRAVTLGIELTVTATPKEGYSLISLTVGSQDILATKKFTVTEAVTVKAVFKTIEEAPKVAITLAKEGEGTLAIEGYNDAALQAVAVGTELTVTATPKDGYTLTSLIADTKDILATKKFTVTGSVTVKAVFKTIEDAPKVAITLAKEGEGALTIKGYNEAALQAVAVGTELTVTATPKEGYKLTSLTAGSQNIFATKKFVVTGAVTVKAVFKKKENNGGGGNNGDTWQPQKPGTAVEDAVLASVVVAPNPFAAQLRIENPEGVAVRYELVNASGVVVHAGAFSLTEMIVDTEALPAGVYFVRIAAQNGAKRVVKVFKY